MGRSSREIALSASTRIKWSEQPSRAGDLLGRLKEREVLWPFITGLLRLLELLIQSVLPIIERSFRFRRLRFLFVPVQHIGHLTIEIDCYVKEGLLGMRPDYRAVVVAPIIRVCNPHLVEYLRRRVTFITNRFLCAILKPFPRMKALQYDITQYAQTMDGTAVAPAINKKWGDRPPLWNLTDEDKRRGRECLLSLGVPEDAWFVCVHCRERGYLQLDIHNFRDINVENYIPAMKAIVERGGWCIRMGDPTMTRLPRMEGVVDYCHSDVRSDWMDVFLSASCRFFLGSSSGLQAIASIFGVPVASANAATFSAVLCWRPGDIGLPKLHWSETDHRFLTFREVLGSPIGDFRHSDLFEEAGVRLVENSPEDVRDLALEMLDRIEGKIVYTREDEMLQDRFVSLMKPGHYTYGSAARVGRDFLRKYRGLMPQDRPEP